jgi:uncharacterized protein YqeY
MKKLDNDLKTAMLARDTKRMMVIRMLKTDVKNREVELMRSLEEPEILEIIQKSIKSRTQSMEMYREGGREDLATAEEQEISILKEYLPAPLSEAELLEAVKASIAELEASSMKDMGRVISAIKDKYGIRVDGKQLSVAVKQELS